MNKKPFSFRKSVPSLFVMRKHPSAPPVLSNCRGMLDEVLVGFLILQTPLRFTVPFSRVEFPHALLGQLPLRIYLFPVVLKSGPSRRQELRSENVLDRERNVVRRGRGIHPGIVDPPEAATECSMGVFVLLEPQIMVHAMCILVEVVQREEVSAGIFDVTFGLYTYTVGATFEQVINDHLGYALTAALAQAVRYFRPVSLRVKNWTM